MKLKFIIIFLFLSGFSALAYSANCGSGIKDCNCGDTLAADYNLTMDLNCLDDANKAAGFTNIILTISSSGLDLNCGNYRILANGANDTFFSLSATGDSTRIYGCSFVGLGNATGLGISNGASDLNIHDSNFHGFGNAVSGLASYMNFYRADINAKYLVAATSPTATDVNFHRIDGNFSSGIGYIETDADVNNLYFTDSNFNSNNTVTGFSTNSVTNGRVIRTVRFEDCNFLKSSTTALMLKHVYDLNILDSNFSRGAIDIDDANFVMIRNNTFTNAVTAVDLSGNSGNVTIRDNTVIVATNLAKDVASHLAIYDNFLGNVSYITQTPNNGVSATDINIYSMDMNLVSYGVDLRNSIDLNYVSIWDMNFYSTGSGNSAIFMLINAGHFVEHLSIHDINIDATNFTNNSVSIDGAKDANIWNMNIIDGEIAYSALYITDSNYLTLRDSNFTNNPKAVSIATSSNNITIHDVNIVLTTASDAVHINSTEASRINIYDTNFNSVDAAILGIASNSAFHNLGLVNANYILQNTSAAEATDVNIYSISSAVNTQAIDCEGSSNIASLRIWDINARGGTGTGITIAQAIGSAVNGLLVRDSNISNFLGDSVAVTHASDMNIIANIFDNSSANDAVYINDVNNFIIRDNNIHRFFRGLSFEKSAGASDRGSIYGNTFSNVGDALLSLPGRSAVYSNTVRDVNNFINIPASYPISDTNIYSMDLNLQDFFLTATGSADVNNLILHDLNVQASIGAVVRIAPAGGAKFNSPTIYDSNFHRLELNFAGVYDLNMQNCRFASTADSNRAVFLSDVNSSSISNSIIASSSGDAVSVSGIDINFSRMTIYGNPPRGFSFRSGARGISVRDSNIFDLNYGISFEKNSSAHDINIIDSNIDAGLSAIWIRDANTIIVSGCDLNGTRIDLNISDSNHITVSTVAMHDANVGIQAMRARDMNVNIATLVHDNNYGLYIVDSNFLTVRDSNIYDNNLHGMVVRNAGDLNIALTNISSNGNYYVIQSASNSCRYAQNYWGERCPNSTKFSGITWPGDVNPVSLKPSFSSFITMTDGGDGNASNGLCSGDLYCGDHVCSASIGETCSNCPGDCGGCGGNPSCGDGLCNNGETCSTCSADCGPCPQTCSQLGGVSCTAAQSCSGNWISGASDTSYCCDGTCIQTGSCSQLGGNICSETQTCTGSWIQAVDSNSCCSAACTALTQHCVSDLFGYACTEGQFCPGYWHSADDAEYCCSQLCTIPTQTCSQLGGSICTGSQVCAGNNFLPANDSESCCATSCEIPTKSCSEQSGAGCMQGQTCEGIWTAAIDSALCCIGFCRNTDLRCVPMGGYICKENEVCTASKLNAIDSERCCSAKCAMQALVLKMNHNSTGLPGDTRQMLVTDNANTPVQGAKVSVTYPDANIIFLISPDNGIASFLLSLPGTYSIRAEKTDYLPFSGNFQIANITIDKKDNVSVGEKQTITVKTSANTPVSDADLTITSPSGKITESQSDSNGQIAFTVKEPGRYKIEVKRNQTKLLDSSFNGTALLLITTESLDQTTKLIFGTEFSEAPYELLAILILAIAAAILAFIKAKAFVPRNEFSASINQPLWVRAAIAIAAFALPMLASHLNPIAGMAVAIVEIAALMLADFIMRALSGAKAIRV